MLTKRRGRPFRLLSPGVCLSSVSGDPPSIPGCVWPECSCCHWTHQGRGWRRPYLCLEGHESMMHDSVMVHNSVVLSSPCLLSVPLVVWTVIHSSIFYGSARQGSTLDKLPVHRSVTEKDKQTFTLKLLPFLFYNSPHMHCGRKLHIVILVANLHCITKALIKFSADILWFPSKQLTAVQ